MLGGTEVKFSTTSIPIVFAVVPAYRVVTNFSILKLSNL